MATNHRTPSISRRAFLCNSGAISLGLMTLSLAGGTACAPQGGSTNAVTFSVGTDLISSDPHRSGGQAASNVQRHIFEPLIGRDASLNLVPLLAKSWTQVDPHTWTFAIRENIRFHDGTTLSGRDVKATFDRIMDKNSPLINRTAVSTLKSVDLVDPMTVRFVTIKPDPVLLSRLSIPSTVILPASVIAAITGDAEPQPVGTGPFKYAEWVKDDHLTMDAFPDYWGTKAKVSRLIHRPIIEASTRVAALRTGTVDFITNVEPQQIAEIESDPKLEVELVPNARVYFVGMNTFRDPFRDVHVRQALNYAVDVDSIIRDLIGGRATRVPSVLSAEQFGFDPTLAPYKYDPELAKKLLADAGFPTGLDVTMHTVKGRYLLDAEIAQAVAGQLAKVDVRVNVEILEYANFLARLFDAKNAENRFTMFYFAYGTPILDADDTMAGYFDSRRRGLYYNDPELDALIAEGQSNVNADERKAVYASALAHLKDAAPWIFLFQMQDVLGVNKRIAGWSARADESISLAEVSMTS
ncbi:MAG: hypothetical protein IT305_10765 [Chloroflexi bacterium]|nr:hypothetical protein [Chloroflexota bacterium]